MQSLGKLERWCEPPQTSTGGFPVTYAAKQRAQARQLVCDSLIPYEDKTTLFRRIEDSRISKSTNLVKEIQEELELYEDIAKTKAKSRQRQLNQEAAEVVRQEYALQRLQRERPHAMAGKKSRSRKIRKTRKSRKTRQISKKK